MSENERNVLRMFADAAVEAEALERLFRSGDGGDMGGGMEERLARVEKNVDKLQSDVADIRVHLATVKENLRHLPTKPWLFTTLAALTTTMIVILTFIMAALVRFLPHAQ